MDLCMASIITRMSHHIHQSITGKFHSWTNRTSRSLPTIKELFTSNEKQHPHTRWPCYYRPWKLYNSWHLSALRYGYNCNLHAILDPFSSSSVQPHTHQLPTALTRLYSTNKRGWQRYRWRSLHEARLFVHSRSPVLRIHEKQPRWVKLPEIHHRCMIWPYM